jgi:hypothetical protein
MHVRLFTTLFLFSMLAIASSCRDGVNNDPEPVASEQPPVENPDDRVVVPPITDEKKPVKQNNEVPQGAEPVRIHWRLKMPYGFGCVADGNFVFRDETSFSSYLGEMDRGLKNEKDRKRYIQWNNVNFKKQMAVVATESDSISIKSVWKTRNEIIVVVEQHYGGIVPAMCVTCSSGVVINRSELPVRFAVKEIRDSADFGGEVPLAGAH